MKLAVVVPMYNEEAGASACVAAVCRVIETLPVPAELIVVEDGSSDGTAKVLQQEAGRYRSLQLVRHAINSGYGAALRSGAEAAARRQCDYVLFMDSDLTNDPADIPRFVEKMVEGVDVIKATRYRHGGEVRGVPAGRVWVSRLGNAVARLLFRVGISDCTNGFRAVRTSLLRRMHLRERRFPVIMEELYCCTFLAESFAEVPVVLTNRDRELRRTSFSYRPSVFFHYLKYAVLAGLRVPPAGRVSAMDRAGEVR